MIETWTRGSADANMPEAILTEQAALVRRHPWWLARARLILAALQRYNILPPSRVLDAGCGWGVTLESLEQAGYVAAGMDISRQALEMLQTDRQDRQLIEADLTQSLSAGESKSPFDAVLALDVLEHLDDDRFALTQLAELLRPGGLVIISVPALPELFSDFDAIIFPRWCETFSRRLRLLCSRSSGGEPGWCRCSDFSGNRGRPRLAAHLPKSTTTISVFLLGQPPGCSAPLSPGSTIVALQASFAAARP